MQRPPYFLSRSWLAVFLFWACNDSSKKTTKGTLSAIAKQKQVPELPNCVYPIIGTTIYGYMGQGITMPFNGNSGRNSCSGCYYNGMDITGFAYYYTCGDGSSAFGKFLITSTSELLNLNTGKEKKEKNACLSKFSLSTEEVHPGYYSGGLDNNNVKLELTISPRLDFHKRICKKEGHNPITYPFYNVRGGRLFVLSNFLPMRK